MPRRFLPILFSTAGLGILLASGGAAVVPSPRENAFRTEAELRFSTQVDDEARALRGTLFKRPAVALVEPQPRPQRAAPARTIIAPPKSKPPAIAPPPAPREISLAERELSLQPAADTPYDSYSGPVRAVISRLDRRPSNMARARALMNEAHAFRYRRQDPYRAALPEATAATRAGDCKAKSLWLYDQLGDPSALYVIGKTFKGTKSNHAWLYWRCDSQWWILDPTNRSTPLLAVSLPNDRYVPYYSFGKAGTFRHPATALFMAGSPAAAPSESAPGGKTRVAKR